MLTQLSRLSVEADGRYATAFELQFLKDYFASVETRLSAYEKMRDAEQEILPRMEAEKQAKDSDLFRLGSRDVTQVCQRDSKRLLLYAATTVLFGDLDYLRENPLLWLKTIVSSFGFGEEMAVTYQMLPQLLQEYLTNEEADLIKPVFQLYRTLLS